MANLNDNDFDGFDDETNVISNDEPTTQTFSSEKDDDGVKQVNIDENFDDIPSANAQNRDTGSNKKLKTLAIFVGAILVAIAGIVMASSRYSENKEKRKAQEAENIAAEQKKMADGTVDIAADQAKIQSSKTYDIPPPADATETIDETNNADVATAQATARHDEPYVPPPNPVPTSQYDGTVAYAPAPMPAPNYEPQPPIVAQPTQPVTEPQPKVADVLVDVYGTKKLTATQTTAQNNERKSETATRRGSADLVLIKGASIPCVLKTKIDSTYQGFTVCQVSKDVYSANGKVLLIERGSSVFGEQNVELKQGQARVYVIWHKIETPKGVSVNVDSPATGQLGEMGVGARVNNHYFQRFGGAIMLSLVQDGIAAASTHLQKEQKGGGQQAQTAQKTINTTEDMATKALDNSINMPPTAVVHQGTIINILVNRDMDFSSVYGVERVF